VPHRKPGCVAESASLHDTYNQFGVIKGNDIRNVGGADYDQILKTVTSGSRSLKLFFAPSFEVVTCASYRERHDAKKDGDDDDGGGRDLVVKRR